MITLLIITMLLSIFGKSAAEPQQGPVTYCKYRESGMRAAVEYIYEQKEDGTCTLSLKENWSDEITTLNVPASVGEELWQIAQKYNMCKYKDSYTPRMRVLDGTMWHLEMKFTQGKNLYTSGENAWPSGGGIHKLGEYLESVWMQYRPKIKKFEYLYRETTVEPRYHVLIEPDENGNYWMTNGSGVRAEEARKAILQEDAYNELYSIINNYKMTDYKRDYRPEYDVFDGYMWNIYVYFGKGEKSVYSSGYNEDPENNGLRRLEKFIDKWWDRIQDRSVPAPMSEY